MPADPDDLPKLSRPARQALTTIGITRLDQVAKHTAREIAELHGMGPKSVRELREAPAQRGKTFLRA